MFVLDISVSNPTSVISPVNNFPVFLLILKEDRLMIEILSDFHNNFRTIIGNASKIKSFKCISNVSDSISLSLQIFGFDFSFKIIRVLRQEMNTPFRKLTQNMLRCFISLTEVSKLWVIFFQRELD